MNTQDKPLDQRRLCPCGCGWMWCGACQDYYPPESGHAGALVVALSQGADNAE